MRQEKRHRQFIFATHNANIPVLGDAELIAALSALGEAGGPCRYPSRLRGINRRNQVVRVGRGDPRGWPRGVRNAPPEVRFLTRAEAG